MADFDRPPVFSSPRLRRKCLHKPSVCAATQSEAAFTNRERLLDNWPSRQSGNVRTSSSLTNNSSTASPRNSSFSLSPVQSSAVRSGMRELWVRACQSHRGSRNSCPRTDSNSASSPTDIGIQCYLPIFVVASFLADSPRDLHWVTNGPLAAHFS